jgi:hypothetical protein
MVGGVDGRTVIKMTMLVVFAVLFCAAGLRLGRRDPEAMTTRGKKQQEKPVGSSSGGGISQTQATSLRGGWFSPALLLGCAARHSNRELVFPGMGSK